MASRLPDGSAYDRDDFAAHFSAFNHQPAYRYRQPESPRSGAAGVEIKHAASGLLLGHMAVAGDHDSESGRRGSDIEPGQVMQNVNADASDLDRFGLRKFSRPRVAVDVAADCGERRDSAQFLQNLRVPHVPGVNDALRTAQCVHSFGAKQSVRVGDDADDDGNLSLLGSVS